MSAVDIGLTRARRQKSQITQTLDLRMRHEIVADHPRILGRAGHSQFQSLQASQQHPGRVRVGDCADDVAQGSYGINRRLGPDHGPGDQVAVSSDIFGQGIDNQIRSQSEGFLPERSQKRVVDQDRRAAGAQNLVARRSHGLDIDQGVGGIGGALEIDGRNIAAGLGGGEHGLDFRLCGAGREIKERDAEFSQYTADECLRRRIQGAGMDDDVPLLDLGQQHCGDRRHARRKHQRVLSVFPDRQAVLQDLLIGAVEPGIDQTFRPAGPDPGDPFEKPLPVGRALEDKCGGQKDRRLQRALRQFGVIAETHHQGGGIQLSLADMGLAMRCDAGFVVRGPFRIGHSVDLVTGGPLILIDITLAVNAQPAGSQAGLRALRAWAMVPSSSQSSSPPTGTPLASMVTVTLRLLNRSAR